MSFMAVGGGAAPAKSATALKKAGKIAFFLMLPGIAYMLLFFLVPMVSLLLSSFHGPVYNASGELLGYAPSFYWQNYLHVLQDYWPHIIRAFLYAFLATVFALLISFPLAYFIGVKARPWPLIQQLTMVMIVAPFFISFLLRTLAWKQLLSDESWIVQTLKAMQILGADQYVTGTSFAVVFGLTYNFIPFMTLPIYTSLERLDLRYVEAGADLYASPFTTFRKVTVPLAMPGIISGTLLTFIPAAGDYINASPQFLGNPSTAVMGTVIESNFLITQNYPAASALSVILMGTILVLVGVYVKKSGTDDLL